LMVSLKSSMNFGMGAMKKARRLRDNSKTGKTNFSLFCVL